MRVERSIAGSVAWQCEMKSLCRDRFPRAIKILVFGVTGIRLALEPHLTADKSPHTRFEDCMTKSTRKLRASIKAIFEPAIEQAGFVVEYPIFRRDDGDVVDVVDIQHWKEGGAFIINAARFSEIEKLPVPRDKIAVGMAPSLRRERFGPRKCGRF
ncbi:MAG: hypothetical protein AAF830_17550, partial [Pseudomonadota bacterium]